MRLKLYALATAVVATTLWPATAEAQFRVTPFFSGAFGGAANQGFGFGDDDPTTDWWGVGVNAGWTIRWLGVEADIAHMPRFFDNDGGFLPNTSLMTAMGNVRLGVPIGMGMMGMGEGAMPFVSVGLGIIRPNIEEAGGLAFVDDSKLGWNVGGGLAGYFSDHVGLEGDIRYFRAMEDDDATPNVFGVDFDGFDFWRAGIGLSFKW